MALRLWVFLVTETTRTAFWSTLLLTYSAHAVVWTGAATVLVRWNLSSSTRHICWRMALFGPFATALFAVAIPWVLARALDRSSSPPEPSVLSLTGVIVSTVSDADREKGESIRGLLAACGAAAAAMGLLRYATSAIQLWRCLRGRTPVHDARLLQRLELMGARIRLGRVLLTQSANIGSPLVIGISEICVPRALLTTLGDGEVDSIFAHELAHLERRDGLWFPLVGLVQSVLWIQPTNHWVATRYRQTAELSCDDRAVELTGDARAMARALTRVAAEALIAHRRGLCPTMARSASALLPRVKRLTDSRRDTVKPSARGRTWPLVTLTALGVATASLSVGGAQAQPSPPDTVGASRRMAALVRRDHELEAQLESALSLPGAQEPGAPASVQVLELRQELRHVRATEVWAEERFVDDWTNWEKRRVVSRRAPASK